MYIVVTGAAGFIGANLVRGAQRARRDATSSPSTISRRRTSSRTSPTARSPTTSTRTSSSARLAAGDFDDERHRDPAPGRVLRHDGDRRPLHDAQQLPLLRRPARRIARTTTSRSSTRRARPCTAAARAFREEREHEAPLNVYGYSKFLFDQYVRRVLPRAHRADRRLPLLQRVRAARGAQGPDGVGRAALLRPVPRRRQACGCSKARAASAQASSGAISSRSTTSSRRTSISSIIPSAPASSTSGPGRAASFNDVAARRSTRAASARRRGAGRRSTELVQRRRDRLRAVPAGARRQVPELHRGRPDRAAQRRLHGAVRRRRRPACRATSNG